MNLAWPVAALYGFMAVACGAFGAHGLKARLSPEMLAVWKTASAYQLAHALALLLLVALAAQKPSSALNNAAWLFIAGTALFSGSLYALALGGPRWLGPLTPLGGLLLLAGWACLCWAGLQKA